jgi:hypothetical protein
VRQLGQDSTLPFNIRSGAGVKTSNCFNTMSDGTHPTSEQQAWLAGVLGRETWEELRRRGDFNRALASSLGLARRIGLQHLAAKELARANAPTARAGRT